MSAETVICFAFVLAGAREASKNCNLQFHHSKWHLFHIKIPNKAHTIGTHTIK